MGEQIYTPSWDVIHQRSELKHSKANSAFDSVQEVKGFALGALAQWGHRKPFVSQAAVLKIEGRMLGKCDCPGCSYSPLAHCPKEMDLSYGPRGGSWARELSGWHHQAEHLVTTNGDLRGRRRGKHPLKPQSAFHLEDTERGREKGQEGILPGLRIWLTLKRGVLNPGCLNSTFASNWEPLDFEETLPLVSRTSFSHPRGVAELRGSSLESLLSSLLVTKYLFLYYDTLLLWKLWLCLKLSRARVWASSLTEGLHANAVLLFNPKNFGRVI